MVSLNSATKLITKTSTYMTVFRAGLIVTTLMRMGILLSTACAYRSGPMGGWAGYERNRPLLLEVLVLWRVNTPGVVVAIKVH
jgi:hypothetical protein